MDPYLSPFLPLQGYRTLESGSIRAANNRRLGDVLRSDDQESFQRYTYKLTRLAAEPFSMITRGTSVLSQLLLFITPTFAFRRFRWASTVVEMLESGGVRAAVIDDWATFCDLTVEKLLWSCIFWLLSAGLGGKPVRTCYRHG